MCTGFYAVQKINTAQNNVQEIAGNTEDSVIPLLLYIENIQKLQRTYPTEDCTELY